MNRLSHKTRTILAVSFCVIVSLSFLFAILKPHRPVDDDLPVLDGLPESAVGFGALAELLRAQGIPVTYKPITDEQLHQEEGLIVIAPVSPRADFPPPRGHVQAHILFVPPKWKLRRDTAHPSWVRTPGAMEDWIAIEGLNLPWLGSTRFFHARDAETVHWRTATQDPPPQIPDSAPMADLRTMESRAWHEVLGDQYGHAILVNIGPMFILSDPDFLNNLGMADFRTASFAVELIDEMRRGKPVWIAPAFSIPVSNRGARPFHLIFNAPFLGATLSLIVAALLMAWQGLVRFGPVLPPDQPFKRGKSSLIESAAGLIERTKRAPRMAPAYANLIRHLAMNSARTGKDPDALLRQMQKRHETTDDFFELQQQAHAIQTPSSLIRWAKALHAWKREMTNGRG